MAAITFPAPTQLKNLLDPSASTDAATKEYVDNAFTSLNNLSLGNLTATGNVTAGHFNGDGSNISNVSVDVANVNGIGNIATLNLDGNSTNVLYGNGTFAALGSTANSNYANYAGNVINASQGNITSVGNLTSLIVVGNLTSGNANLGNLVSANYIKGNGSLITFITGANVSGYVPNANIANTAYAVSGSNVSGQVSNALVAGTVYTNAQPNITSVGTLSSLAVTGNITAGNLTGANLVSANFVSGDGGLLSNIIGGNVTGQVGNALVAGTVYTATQPNITSVGTLSNLSVTNNVTISTGNLDLTAGDVWANSGTVKATYLQGTLVAASNYQPNITGLGTLGNLNVTGNTSTGNLIVTGNTTIGGNLTVTGTTYTVSANNIAFSDSLVQLHVDANLDPLTTDDGQDIGLQMHYFKTTNKSAFLVWANDTGALEYYGNGTYTSGDVTGTYGNIKAASFISNIANGTQPLFVNSTTEVANLNAEYANIVTGNVQSNITQVGTLTTLSVSGNITSGTGSGGNISGVNYMVANNFVGNLVTASQPNITSLGNLTSLIVRGKSNLNTISNVTITGGSNGQYLTTDGTGNLNFTTPSQLTSAVDNFTGDGTTTAFSLSATPGNVDFTFVSIGGVMQPRSYYSVSGAVLTFTTAPPDTSIVEVTTLGGSVTGQTANANYANFAGNVVNSSQPNITSVGTLTSLTAVLPQVSNVANASGIVTYNPSNNQLSYGPQSWFRGGLSGAITPTSSADYVILWNSNSDPINMYNSGNGHIVPGITGWYMVTFRLTLASNGSGATGQVNSQIRVNGNQQLFSQCTSNQAQYNGFTLMNTGMVYLSSITDYITTTVYVTTSGQQILGGTSSSLIVQWVSN